MKRLILIILLAITSYAQAAGDVAAGKEKSLVCAACHGANGQSVNPIWPNLAGQHAKYTVDQLKAFKEGKTRADASMMGMVANLSEQDMADLAAFYAAQPLAENIAKKEGLKEGEMLYRGGDFTKGIPACIACHGPRGLGNSQAGFPVVSGQHAQYTIQQLNLFKKGTRKNDYHAIMRDISMRMSDEDMSAVANYISGLN